MKKTILIELLLLSFGYLSFAQNCKICVEALRQETKDVFVTEKKHSLDESVSLMYSYDYEFWENYQSSSNKTMSLDAAYSVYKASFGSSSNDGQRKETYNKQKSSFLYTRSLTQDDYEKISQTLVSKIPYETFTKCVINTCSEGIFVESETTGDNIVITVTWVVKSDPTGRQTTLKFDPTIANATPINYNLQKGAILKPFNSISGLYKRVNSKEKSIFSFDFDGFPTQQETVKSNSYQNFILPVGTVISSALDYATFCSLNDIPLNVEMDELIWVPADGRSVKGSVYGRRRDIVPDFRGTFLRGLNIFDPLNNPVYAKPEQKDPDNRSVNDIQKYAIEAHAHNIADPGHSHVLDISLAGGGKESVRYRPVGDGTQTITQTRNGPSNITVLENKGVETRPTNIAVYYYIKIN